MVKKPLLNRVSGLRWLSSRASRKKAPDSELNPGLSRMLTRKFQRRVSAVLAADIAGFSRMMELDETGTLSELTKRHDGLIVPKLAKHKGRLVKTMGDGFLAEFTFVAEAVLFAVDLQRAMAERNAAVPSKKRMDYRIGVNLGDVIIVGDDIFGEQVNITARLENLAEPGGICLSGDAYRQSRRYLDLAYEDLGEHKVKSLEEPIRVYRVRLDGGAGNP